MSLLDNQDFIAFIAHFNKLMLSVQQTSLEEGRKECTAFFSPPDRLREEVSKITDLTVKGREGNEIPVRIYAPSFQENLPLLIYYHSGGWVFSNIEEADPLCRKLANHLGCIVASVDYRLAPENPFPKPLNDCYDSFLWLAQHAAELGANKDKVIVCGESAGGNMAAVVALQARDQNLSLIAAQLLFYPVISSNISDTAYKECPEKYFLTKESMQFFWSMYLSNPLDGKNWTASPDLALNFKGLPPALIITAEYDPLHIEGESYAQLLKEADNQVIVERYEGVIHRFLDLPIYSDDQVNQWLAKIKNQLDSFLKITT
jgi:acetyl esterase